MSDLRLAFNADVVLPLAHSLADFAKDWKSADLARARELAAAFLLATAEPAPRDEIWVSQRVKQLLQQGVSHRAALEGLAMIRSYLEKAAVGKESRVFYAGIVDALSDLLEAPVAWLRARPEQANRRRYLLAVCQAIWEAGCLQCA